MKTMQGTVTSLKNIATATVSVTTKWQHPLYKKYVKRSKKYACHYENLELALGDTVTIEECKPISKTKHFKVVSKDASGKITQKVETAPVKAKAKGKAKAKAKK